MTLAYFQLERFADQAERDVKDDIATAEYCEARGKELLKRAAELRSRAERRQAEAVNYRTDADRLYWKTEGMEAAE